MRQCELQGVEASTEIQVAARTVADENKKLRAILTHHGISDDAVEAALHNNNLMVSNGSYSAAVQTLEHVLATKKHSPCVTGCGPAAARVIRDGSVSTAQGSWPGSSYDHPQNMQSMVVTNQIHQYPQHHQQQQQQLIAPQSNYVRAPSFSLGHSSNVSSHGQSQQQHHHVRNTSMSSTASSIAQHNNEQYHDAEYNYDQYPMYQPQSHESSSHQMHATQSNNYAPTADANSNSCVFATDMITAMAGGDPGMIRQELGCGSKGDCQVDNNVVFNVMDRYSGIGS